MKRTIIVFLAGLILGSLLQQPTSAQTAARLWATLSTDLTSGTSTALLCTANGTGCYLQVQAH